MRRRGFLGFLTALVTLPMVKRAPVRAIRVPLVIQPKARYNFSEDVITAELERVRVAIPALFDGDDHFYNRIGQHGGGGRRRQGRRAHSVERG